jgi:hypothetical protein
MLALLFLEEIRLMMWKQMLLRSSADVLFFEELLLVLKKR